MEIGKLFKKAPNRYKFLHESIQSFNSSQINPLILESVNNINTCDYPTTHGVESFSEIDED